jgi:hypothetical protein
LKSCIEVICPEVGDAHIDCIRHHLYQALNTTNEYSWMSIADCFVLGMNDLPFAYSLSNESHKAFLCSQNNNDTIPFVVQDNNWSPHLKHLNTIINDSKTLENAMKSDTPKHMGYTMVNTMLNYITQLMLRVSLRISDYIKSRTIFGINNSLLMERVVTTISSYICVPKSRHLDSVTFYDYVQNLGSRYPISITQSVNSTDYLTVIGDRLRYDLECTMGSFKIYNESSFYEGDAFSGMMSSIASEFRSYTEITASALFALKFITEIIIQEILNYAEIINQIKLSVINTNNINGNNISPGYDSSDILAIYNAKFFYTSTITRVLWGSYHSCLPNEYLNVNNEVHNTVVSIIDDISHSIIHNSITIMETRRLPFSRGYGSKLYLYASDIFEPLISNTR